MLSFVKRPVRTITASDVHTQLRDLLDSVEHGGMHIVITRWERPAVALVPMTWYLAQTRPPQAVTVQLPTA